MMRNVPENSENAVVLDSHSENKVNLSGIIQYMPMILFVLLIVFFDKTAQSVRNSLHLCFNTVIPSLFPFLVLIPLTIASGGADLIGKILSWPVKILFSLPGYCSFPIVIGFISGCPGCAGAVRDMYKSGKCTKGDAEKVIAFCNNMSPSFIISGVGAGMIGNIYYGVILFVVQIISSVVVGIIVCRIGNVKDADKSKYSENVSEFISNDNRRKNFSNDFISSVRGATVNIISISSFVIFFGIISDQVSLLISHIGFFSEYAETIFKMFLEITSGCRDAASLKTETALILISAGAGWSGLSSHAQVSSVIRECGLSMKKYFIGKVMQSVSAIFFMIIAINFIV